MALAKGNFLMPVSKAKTFVVLSNEEAGKIIKAIYKFVSDGEIDTREVFSDRLLCACYEEILEFVKENENKYADRCAKNKENGEHGGRPAKDS